MSKEVTVFAPATISNLACGFDTLGLALDKPGDEITARFSDTPGLRITGIYGAEGKLPKEVDKNTAGVAALGVLERVGEMGRGIEMEIHKKMPFGSGLGSSAASAVAGAMAVNELLGRPLAKHDLLPFVLAGEQIASGDLHADNIAPSLLGGIVFVHSVDPLEVHQLPSPPGLYVAAVYPQVEVLTKDSRNLLKSAVPLKDMVRQAANLGSFVAGCYRSDLELMSKSMVDLIIEPQRAHLIPHFYDVKDAALNEGAMACSISGAGPTIFALCSNSFVAEKVGEKMRSIYSGQQIAHQVFLSPINEKGAVKY